MAGFIGLKIDQDKETGVISLTQTGLMDMILDVTGMDDSNPKYTSAENDPLHKDGRGGLCCEEWNYCSVVGMMLYLAGSTRPDIAYAVHPYA